MKNSTPIHTRGRRAAYSLVEVLAAAGIITLGVGAAVALSFATVSLEETSMRTARALCVQENAARLFELGLSGDEILRLLPPDPVVSSIVITETNNTVSAGITLQQAEIDIVYETSPSGATWSAGTWTGGPGGTASTRSFADLYVLRPTTRAGFN